MPLIVTIRISFAEYYCVINLCGYELVGRASAIGERAEARCRLTSGRREAALPALDCYHFLIRIRQLIPSKISS